jgi:hypothetical protein
MRRRARRLAVVKRPRSFRLVLSLALLLNVLGNPMALAHWLGGGGGGNHAHAAAVAEMAPACHGHGSSADHAARPGTLPCCDGNGCACAAAALVVRVTVQSRGVSAPLMNVPFESPALRAHPLDDSLRPPIV